jgi:hypothetical protein
MHPGHPPARGKNFPVAIKFNLTPNKKNKKKHSWAHCATGQAQYFFPPVTTQFWFRFVNPPRARRHRRPALGRCRARIFHLQIWCELCGALLIFHLDQARVAFLLPCPTTPSPEQCTEGELEHVKSCGVMQVDGFGFGCSRNLNV